MGFPRQEYWSGLPFPSPGDLPYLRIEPMSSELADRFLTTEPPGKPDCIRSVLWLDFDSSTSPLTLELIIALGI